MHTAGTTPLDSDASQTKSFDPTGWELALVTAPSTNLSSVQERQLVCPVSFIVIELDVPLSAYFYVHPCA